MRWPVGLFVAATVALASPAHAEPIGQPPTPIGECSPKMYESPIEQDTAIVKPEGFTMAAIATISGQTIASVKSLGDIGSTWTKDQIDALTQAKSNQSQPVVLLWADASGRRCVQGYTRRSAPPPNAPPPNAPPPNAPPPSAPPPSVPVDTSTRGPTALHRTYNSPDDCGDAGAAWTRELAADNPGGRQTVIVFRDDVGVCFQTPARPSQGDLIHVAVFTSTPDVWDGVRAQFQPCSLQPATPAILITGSIADLPPGLRTRAPEAPRWVLRTYVPRQCWNESVAVTLQGGDQRQIAYTLTQANRYRATLHVGAVFTENHEVSFGLRPDGSSNRVFAQGPTDRGPEYVAALVFYGLPHYFADLFGGAPYPGRDPIRETGLADRIGGVIGVGLRNPLKRFVAGVSFELAAGINVIVARDFVQTSTLAGIAEGDAFAGTAQQIPTRQEWRTGKWVAGITLDLVYAATAFKR